jgi:outer membrane protein OmpA-like peptidoglycan-associated protein
MLSIQHCRRSCLPALAFLTMSSIAHPGRGDTLKGLSLRGETGVGTMLSRHQRTDLGYNVGVQSSLRLAVAPIERLALQVTYSHWAFPGDRGAGRANLLGGGLRFAPVVFRSAHVFTDGNLGVAWTGRFRRMMFDAGLGFEYAALGSLSFGPVARYGQIRTGPSDMPTDAKFWSLGAAITLRQPAPAPPPPPLALRPTPPPPPPPPPPVDTDQDGVADAQDLCPPQPAGPHPDPARAGCPRPDADADGMFDDEDQCPTLAAGSRPDPQRSGCPDGDDDNDGVFNSEDQCRTQHRGLTPDPSQPGCPQPDRDNDSVADTVDACPDKPGAPHPEPAKNGCPGLVLVENDRIVILKPVFFATLKDRILSKSFPLLQAVANALRATRDIRRVSIEGHTDSQGDDAFNLDLSQRRASNVVRYLIEQGVEPSRLEPIGYGETRPIQSNQTARGRASNRRVEFRIVDPAPPPIGPS